MNPDYPPQDFPPDDFSHQEFSAPEPPKPVNRTGKLPPQVPDSERYVLGAMLQDVVAVDDARKVLSDEDFYSERHQQLFFAMAQLDTENLPIDFLTVEEQLKKNEKLEVAGGRAYMMDLLEEVASSASTSYHAEIIKEKSLLRTLIYSSNEIIKRSFDPTVIPEDVLNYAVQNILSVSEKKVSGGLTKVSEILKLTLEQLDNMKGDELTGVPTGFSELDRLTNGLQSTDFIVLAGRPGMGKTAFALSLAANAGIKYDKATAFFSLEMGGEQLVQRVLCSQAAINMQALRQGTLPKAEYKKIPFAAKAMNEAPIYIDDEPGISLVDLKAKCRLLKKKQRLDMVIIDYLQLMTGPKSENRQNEISAISRGLKELAKELHIPVLALSQLSRKVEDRGGDGKPIISDLRESGAIEQDADMIWFVYRPAVYAKRGADVGDVTDTDAELIVAKHRNGPTKDIKMTFIGEHAAFYNYAPRADSSFEDHI